MMATPGIHPDLIPVPEITEWDEGFWAAAKDGRLVVQACADCGTVRGVARVGCQQCHSLEHVWLDAGTRGTIFSWARNRRTFHPAFEGRSDPFVLLVVALDAYPVVHMVARLDEPADAPDPAIGEPVEVYFEALTDEITLPMWRRIR